MIRIILLILVAAIAASGQPAPEPKAGAKGWVDLTAGDGAVLYPQGKAWINTGVGKIGSFCFLESAPHERLFGNCLVNFTPSKAQWFTFHGEAGGLPAYGLGFVQFGPRLNFVAAAPKTSKLLKDAFVAYLPELTGIRTRNTLVAVETQKFPLFPGGKINGSIDFFDRIFPNKNPDYGELCFPVQVRGSKHVTPIVLVIRSGGRYTVTAGVRVK